MTIQVAFGKALHRLTPDEKQRRYKTAEREKMIWWKARNRIIHASYIAYRMQESKKRKVYREKFLQLSISEQIIEMATNYEYTIKVFPINPDQISKYNISQLPIEERESLLDKVETRWEKRWKNLARRIRKKVVNNER